ncbi:MAG: V-type ATP synthase subunit D [Spirochaetales bacterium]|nr:V-type ATP synthase subunit D [Spirochaetales bacterium]
MAKIKLTKNEQKKQKDSLKRFQRYLPTLILKKQQLQMVIRKVELQVEEKESAIEKIETSLKQWIRVFGENEIFDVNALGEGFDGIESLVVIKSIKKGRGNIAGVDIPVFDGLEYEDVYWDLFKAPLWIDRGVTVLKDLAVLNAQIEVLREQKRLLGHELRVTTQRVNLFEKVKIPETKENIRMISIYLGDQQTAAVVRGKMAKNKVVKVS